MSSKKHERRIAREAALSLLYSSDIAESDLEQVIEEGLYPGDGEDGLVLSDYAESLVLGVVEHRDDIDARLEATSENWAIERMPTVDRAILRLAVFEMAHVDEVPVSVAINEAVDLAKAYGGEDDSSRFVNGVLGRIARALEAEAADALEGAEGAAAEGAAAETVEAAEAAEAAEGAAEAAEAGASEPSTEDANAQAGANAEEAAAPDEQASASVETAAEEVEASDGE